MTKIVLLGPESSGKSTLALELAEFFNGCYVKEYARDYLNEINRDYAESDLLKIAKGQIDLEKRIENKCSDIGKELIFFDTDMTVLKIWSEFKFGQCHPWIISQYREREYDLYLLTYPDLEWVPDPLRENPDDREKIFELYLDDLQKRELKYKIIRGSGSYRTQYAIKAVKEVLS